MKKLILILLIPIISISGCRKEDQPTDISLEISLPFESNTLKMDLISTTLPDTRSNMHFFNETAGILVTYDSKIYKTYDKGLNWSVKYINPISNQDLYQILFLDQNTGYVVGGEIDCIGSNCIIPGGLILKTTDGGETWTNIFQMEKVEFKSITKNSTGDLFVIANYLVKKGLILKSSNAGNSWTIIDSTAYTFSRIIFSDNYGYCTGQIRKPDGSIGIIYRSNDNGNSWTKITTSAHIYLFEDAVFKSNVGLCLGNYSHIYKTIDYGENWIQIHNGQSYKIDILTSNSYLIWGGGGWYEGNLGYETGAVRQSKNGGQTWIDHNFTKDIGQLDCSSFYSPTEGYVLAGVYLIKVTVK